MKIERVILRDVRALRERDDSFVGPDGVFSSACLRGLNGSGKTTYLEAIAQLWEWFRLCTQKMAYVTPRKSPLLSQAGLVAVLFADLPGPRAKMWIAFGNTELVRELLVEGPDSPLLDVERWTVWDPAVLVWWARAFATAESTGQGAPNIVYIEAENKFVPALRRDEMSNPAPVPAYFPLARYGHALGGHLEVVMRALRLALPDRWTKLVSEFSRLRPNLRLLDTFDANTQRPLIQREDGVVLTVDVLSAGERSVLINLCMTLRWLAPGGIVLIDEPELHQHVSLMRGSVAVLDVLVQQQFSGQLIVSSHAPEVWDHFRMHDTVVDLDA